jgi:hypothetical protein
VDLVVMVVVMEEVDDLTSLNAVAFVQRPGTEFQDS